MNDPGLRGEPSRQAGRGRSTDLGAFHAAREITTVPPIGRWLSDYEVSICRAQTDPAGFDTGGWYVLRPDGSGVYDEALTAVRHPDWSEFRDPSAMWQRNYVALQAEEEASLRRNLDSAEANNSYADVSPRWCSDVLGPYYEAWACAESGLFIALSRGVREALSDTVSMSLLLGAVDRARHQQDIAAASLHLVAQVPTYTDGSGPTAWECDPVLAPTRRFVQRLLATRDWAEVAIAVALVFDPLIAEFFLSQFLRRFAPANGDTVTPYIIVSTERDRRRYHDGMAALVAMLLTPHTRRGLAVPAQANREVVQGWLESWCPRAIEAVEALIPIVDLAPHRIQDAHVLRVAALAYAARTISEAGLEVPTCLES